MKRMALGLKVGKNAVVSAPFCKVSFSETNLNSPEQMKKYLLSQGWIPDSWTEKGSPQLTESSYPSIKGMRVIQGGEVSAPFKINGELKQVVARWFE